MGLTQKTPAPKPLTELARVENSRPCNLTLPPAGKFPPRVLVPGGNNLPADHVQALMDLDPESGTGKNLQSWMDLGWVRFLTPSESRAEVQKPEGPEAPRTLMDRPAAAASALISTERNTSVLRTWLASERRDVVRQDLLARLDVVDPQGPPKAPQAAPASVPSVPPVPAVPPVPSIPAAPAASNVPPIPSTL